MAKQFEVVRMLASDPGSALTRYDAYIAITGLVEKVCMRTHLNSALMASP